MPRSNPKPFEKSYPLMTMGRMLGLPIIMVSMVLVAFILVGCFEPRMSVDCVRGTTVTCTFEERTWINHKGPTTLALDDTEIDLERGHKNNTKLLILNRKDGSTAFRTGVNNAGANNVKREIDQFLASPSAPSLKLTDQGMNPFVVLFGIPFVLFITFIPIAALGGRLDVFARDGQVGATRRRILFGSSEVSLTFPPGEKPTILLERYQRSKQRSQAMLSVTASTGTVVLCRNAYYPQLAPIEADLLEVFERRGV